MLHYHNIHKKRKCDTINNYCVPIVGIYPWEYNSSYTVIEAEQPDQYHAYHEKDCRDATSKTISFRYSGGPSCWEFRHVCGRDSLGGSISRISFTIHHVYQDMNEYVSLGTDEIVALIQRGYGVADALVGILPHECVDLIQQYMYYREHVVRARRPDYM
jgi:hypothetical protein